MRYSGRSLWNGPPRETYAIHVHSLDTQSRVLPILQLQKDHPGEKRLPISYLDQRPDQGKKALRYSNLNLSGVQAEPDGTAPATERWRSCRIARCQTASRFELVPGDLRCMCGISPADIKVALFVALMSPRRKLQEDVLHLMICVNW